jgi:hypothetical protein
MTLPARHHIVPVLAAGSLTFASTLLPTRQVKSA